MDSNIRFGFPETITVVTERQALEFKCQSTLRDGRGGYRAEYVNTTYNLLVIGRKDSEESEVSFSEPFSCLPLPRSHVATIDYDGESHTVVLVKERDEDVPFPWGNYGDRMAIYGLDIKTTRGILHFYISVRYGNDQPLYGGVRYF